MDGTVCVGFVLAALLVAGCASAQVPEPRERFIRARDHGWIELEVRDVAIPSVPLAHADGTVTQVRPQSCKIRLLADGEPVLEQLVFPTGSTEPYSVQSGFRIPLAVGSRALELGYSGCRVDDLPSQRQTINVGLDMLTVLSFDGTSLESSEPIPDPAHTIESIGRAVGS